MTSNWQTFEYLYQVQYAPLLADTTQRDLFRVSNRCHERMFLDLVRRVIRPSHFFEIGAHEASTSQALAKQLPNCECVAFEADPEVYEHFNRDFAGKDLPRNFHYQQVAMSDHDGEITFFKQAGADTILKNNSLKKKNADDEYYSVITMCSRLDTFAERYVNVEKCVLRIDAEGLAYEVLSGASNILDNCAAIYSEVEDYEIWDNQKLAFDVYELLEEKGFVPVTRDIESAGQYNVFWLPKSDAIKRKFRSRIAIYHTELMELARQSLDARSDRE